MSDIYDHEKQTPEQRAVDFRRSFWLVIGAILLLITILFCFSILLKLDSLKKDHKIKAQATQAKNLAANTRREAERTTVALCSFRSDLQRRHDETAELLHSNPAVFDRLGISRGSVRKSLHDQESVLASFEGLHCQPIDHITPR